MKRRGRRFPIVITGAIVVLGAVVAAWWLWPAGKTRQDAASTKRGLIKEVKPAVAPTNAVAQTENVEYRKLEDGRIMKYVDGKKAWMYPRQEYHGPVHTGGLHRAVSLEQRTFKNSADRHIAYLLRMRPGSSVTGNPRYDKFFVKSFLESYNDPFIPEPGDTEEQKELKKAVAEVKGELKARYEAGEDIAKIMSDAREEMRQLGAYKREIEQHVAELSKKEEVTAQDIEDYVAAANKMLTDRGIPPMKIRGFIQYQLQLRLQEKSQKESQNNEVTP